MTQRNAHWLIAKTAREMAEELYEEYVRDNRFYALMKEEDRYVQIARAHGIRNPKREVENREALLRRMTQELLEDARQAVAHLLTRYDFTQQAKDDIAEALIQDNQLRFGRTSAPRNR